MTTAQSEDAFILECRSALAIYGLRAGESRGPNGIYLVSGYDREGLPFFAGHPGGRAAAWRAACMVNKVPVPEVRSDAAAPS